MTSASVAIVGAGLGGLACALALSQRGLDVRVYEQAPKLTEVGAGVQLSANATRVLQALGIGPALASTAVVPTDKLIRLWNSGEAFKAFDVGPMSEALYGAPYLTLHRHDLQAALAQALEAAAPGSLKLGRRCVGLELDEEGVDLLFEGGGRERAQLVVGADGVHSQVRRTLFGASDPVFTGVVAWRGVIPAARLDPAMLAPVSTTWIGPAAHAVTYPLRGGALLNYVSVVERDDWRVESWSCPGTVEECLADYRGWSPQLLQVIAAIETPYKWALFGRAPMPRWSDGRATLLGDACHPMLPFLSQGAAMAIEDALVLARCLERWPGDIGQALGRYEAARIGRTTRAVEGSAANQQRYHALELKGPDDARRYVAQQWAEPKVRERYDWIFSYDATSVPL